MSPVRSFPQFGNLYVTLRIPLASSLLASALAFGEGTRETGGSSLELPEATVQASRKGKTPDKLPQKVEVITARDMALTPADDLTDQLKKSTSIDVIQYPGLLSGVGMRGFRPQFGGLNQRTLLLVDGRPAGATNYAAVDLMPVERVEIVKGPFSALYGAQAMGGVINVVPRRTRGAIVTEAKAVTGSFGRFQGAVVSGGSLSEKLNYDLALQAFTLSRDVRIGREYSLSNLGLVEDRRATLRPAGGPEEKVEELGDGQLRPNTQYEEQGGVLRLGWDIDGNWTVETRTDVYDAPNAENPGDIFYGAAQPGRKSVEKYGGDARLLGSIGGHALEVNAYRAREYNENYNVTAGFKNSESTLDFLGFGLRDNLAWRSHTFTAGVEYQTRGTEGRNWSSATARSAPLRPDYGISNVSAYGEAYLSFLNDRLIGTLGARYDHIVFDVLRTDFLTAYRPGSEDYNVVSPSAGLLYRFASGIRLRATAGRGFVTPDAFQVAGYSESFKGSGRVAVTRGNPDLKPEQNITVDGGLGYEKPSLGLSADLT
jgi:vitamin B12 transporter